VRYAALFVLLAALPGVADAQSSQFGVRGLGFPGRGLAVRAAGSSGAFGLFDPESSLNPAALGAVPLPRAFATRKTRPAPPHSGTLDSLSSRWLDPFGSRPPHWA
jgi:hypothetical protein